MRSHASLRAGGHASGAGGIVVSGPENPPEADSLKGLLKTVRGHWKRYSEELKRCKRGVSPETVHTSRVAGRRLLATIQLLDSFLPARRVRKLSRALKRHLDQSDELRDTQAHLEALARMRSKSSAARDFKAYLRKREKRLLRQTRKNLARNKTRRLEAWLKACRKQLAAHYETTAPSKAWAVLQQRLSNAFDRVVKLRAAIDPDKLRTIHRTRIAFKHFRYMVEAVAESLPGFNSKCLVAMRRYQGLMGAIQDSDVLLAELDRFLKKKPSKADSMEMFRNGLLRQRQQRVRRFLAVMSQLDHFRPGTVASRAPKKP